MEENWREIYLQGVPWMNANKQNRCLISCQIIIVFCRIAFHTYFSLVFFFFFCFSFVFDVLIRTHKSLFVVFEIKCCFSYSRSVVGNWSIAMHFRFNRTFPNYLISILSNTIFSRILLFFSFFLSFFGFFLLAFSLFFSLLQFLFEYVSLFTVVYLVESRTISKQWPRKCWRENAWKWKFTWFFVSSFFSSSFSFQWKHANYTDLLLRLLLFIFRFRLRSLRWCWCACLMTFWMAFVCEHFIACSRLHHAMLPTWRNENETFLCLVAQFETLAPLFRFFEFLLDVCGTVASVYFKVSTFLR